VRRSSSFSSRIGVVTGLESEAKIVRKRLTLNVVCSGGDPARAAWLAQTLIANGATSLMSIGIAGGLNPDLKPGTLIVADEVVTDYGRYPAVSTCARSIKAQVGRIYAGLDIVADTAKKSDLFARTGAQAVDMESGAVARVAYETSIPFIGIRAIADPAWHGLPSAALLKLTTDGRPRLGAVFWSVLTKPGQIPALITTARETGEALESLRNACRRLGK
jgi:hopanoid-associated phosphorylase